MNAAMPKTFFITTAIDYTNSPPHVGHAYEKVLADVIARYHRLKGEKVFFLTGVDQHGQKVQQSAAKAGVPPAEFVKGITQKFIDLWEKLDVQYDEWAETTSDRHKKVVQGILQRLFDEGQIYKDKQSGYYSVRQEQFLTDKERGPDGQFGPEWGEIEFREEENYYFKLSQHKEWLLQYLDNRTGCGHSRFSSDGIAQRSRKNQRRSLYLASEIAARLGNRATVRQRFRHLRLVRRPNELHQFRRLRSYVLKLQLSTLNHQLPRQMARAPSHRQRHSRSGARHLLAHHAARDRVPRRSDAAIARSRLVEPRRRRR